MNATTDSAPDLRAGRLCSAALAGNFADLDQPLDGHEAAVAAERCYFCHDAPCIAACPTAIDIPLFIRQIATGQPQAAARTILAQNIMGGICARVCPTETLCEEACVREAAEGKPVEIGRLQRFATDAMMGVGVHPFARATPSGRRVAVIGAGPAGLACAHRLAMLGHAVTVFDARPKAGGLNEYGIAAYKVIGGFAEAEVEWLCAIGGITVERGRRLGADLDLATLRRDFDAVFLGIGLGGVNAPAVPGAGLGGVRDAVDFIAELRQADDLAGVAVGREVVVIGGGMTAVDAAVQARLLGAETVSMVYRRGRERMAASRHERDLAAARGVQIVTRAVPRRIIGEDHVEGVEFQRTSEDGAPLDGARSLFRIPADQVLLAIGQRLEGPQGLPLCEKGKIVVDVNGRTDMAGVWAGGDCASGGQDLTVVAVAQGRDAAMDIHAALTAGGGKNGQS